MSYQPTPVKTQDGTRKGVTADDRLWQLMNLLTIEQRITNVHLSHLTKEYIAENDLEEN